MTGLWISVIALLLVALLALVWPLLRHAGTPQRGVASPDLARRVYADQLARLDDDLRQQTLGVRDRAEAVEDLQRQMLDELRHARAAGTRSARPWMAWGVAGALSIALPAAAFLLYLKVGDPGAAAAQVVSAQRSGHESDGQDMESMVTRLTARLKAQPDNVEGWIVLARSHEVLQRFDDAVAAYRKAMALAPDEPNLMADYADALASARGGDLEGPVRETLDAALAIDPVHAKSLALAGMAAYRRGDLALARTHWERVLAVVPPESEAVQAIQDNLARLDQAQAAEASPPAAANPTAAAQPAAGASKHVAGTITIAPALRAQTRPEDTVFILARAAAAGRAPVAVMRLKLQDLPAKFVLDDRLAMRPETRISQFDTVSVEVRISRSGQAMAQPGDLSGTQAEVKVGAQDVEVLVDSVVN